MFGGVEGAGGINTKFWRNCWAYNNDCFGKYFHSVMYSQRFSSLSHAKIQYPRNGRSFISTPAPPPAVGENILTGNINFVGVLWLIARCRASVRSVTN